MPTVLTTWAIVLIVICCIFVIFSICLCIICCYKNKQHKREKHRREMLRQRWLTEKNAEEARIEEEQALTNAKEYPDVPRPHHSTTPSYQTTGFQPAQMQPSPPPLAATPAPLPVSGFAHSPPEMQSPNYGWSPNQPPPMPPSPPRMPTTYQAPAYPPGFAPSSPGHQQPVTSPFIGWKSNEPQPSILLNPSPPGESKPITKINIQSAVVEDIQTQEEGRSVRSQRERRKSDRKGKSSKSRRSRRKSKTKRSTEQSDQ